MSSLTIGFLGLATLVGLLALRMPIALALGLVSVGGIAVLRGSDAALGALGTMLYDFAANWLLAAVPMFLLLGSVAFHSGLTGHLYDAARMWLNRLPGGLAVASNVGAAAFAATSGSSVATSAAMGRLAIPEMLRFGYDKGLATATIAAAGTLGALIPPSIPFVIYGWYTETSIGALLIAGILPGLLTGTVYAVMIVARCRLNPGLAPPVAIAITPREKWRALARTWPILLIVIGIVGGIYGGVATPSEAGAFGAAIAIVIATLQGRFGLTELRNSVSEALMTTGSIFFIAIGAVLFTRFLAIAGVPRFLSTELATLSADPFWITLGMSAVYVVLGAFLDPLGLMLLTLPIFLPLLKTLGMDLIWFGVIVVKFIEIGCLTPPVGLNAFIVKSVVGDTVPLYTIFRGLVWFLACEALIMTLLFAFPGISLFLPSLM